MICSQKNKEAFERSLQCYNLESIVVDISKEIQH